MALSIEKWYLGATVIDKQGNPSVMEYEIEFGSDFVSDDMKIDEATSLVGAFATAYGNVGSGKVVKTFIRREMQETDASVPTLNNPEVNRKATLTMQLAGVPDKGLIVIPSPLDTIFVNNGVGLGGNTVDTSNAQLQAWCNQFIALPATDVGKLMISDGQHANSNTPLEGKRTFRRTRSR